MVASTRSNAGLSPRRHRRLAHGGEIPEIGPVEYAEPMLALSPGPIRNLTVGSNS